ncbi:MAG: metalloregulator ArsR/SmtB family transcription factor [Rhodanobacteraceae bacterium]|nr:metalloregulator ArsR/SmtB family transcription factor [Rhodanobacteraceae bacterium]
METPPRIFKNKLYEQFARLGKALAAPKRLELLDLLSQGPRTVEALADLTGITIANASQHLQVLRTARLVASEKLGLFVEYRLADEAVGRFIVQLQELAQLRLTEVEQITRSYLDERGALEAVYGEELLRRVRDGDVTVIDVRPREEYAAGHVPGAISIPVGELAARLKELPKQRDIVAYCRGPYCVMAIEAVALLREHGYTAQRMEQGVVDWRARGWQVAVEPQLRQS